ncbi:hypothetical protein PUV47_16375 [Pseudovibrio exalbescens]|uniref:hypothetical protein n=1 Tax=Pseudovibrio exalbescens TaxID=197461 RepID=UPI00236626DE|nr:hypothetical protein [Pseudovibrio exalbescens]MDD7911508.1 hypothetical protein [Pseudovibrio exalbescens]
MDGALKHSLQSLQAKRQSRLIRKIRARAARNRTTLGEAEILIRDEDRQQEPEESGATTSLASLNRDLTTAQEITRDEEEYLRVYISDEAVRVVQIGITEAIKSGGFVDTYLLDKQLTEDERHQNKQSILALRLATRLQHNLRS